MVVMVKVLNSQTLSSCVHVFHVVMHGPVCTCILQYVSYSAYMYISIYSGVFFVKFDLIKGRTRKMYKNKAGVKSILVRYPTMEHGVKERQERLHYMLEKCVMQPMKCSLPC